MQASSSSGLPTGSAAPATGAAYNGSYNCPGGGSYTYSYDFASTSGTISSGDTFSANYNNCSFGSGVSANGSSLLTYTRWVSYSDYAFTQTMKDYRVTSGSYTYGPYSYTTSYDAKNGVVTYSSSINGTTVIGKPTVSTSGSTATISSGKSRSYYGNGSNWVEISYSNWSYDTTTGRPTSGTITVNGSTGSATITVTSTGYNVAINVNGATKNYTVAF